MFIEMSYPVSTRSVIFEWVIYGFTKIFESGFTVSLQIKIDHTVFIR